MEQIHATVRYAGLLLEFAGIAIIVLASLYATAASARRWYLEGGDEQLFRSYRVRLGRGILLGLEFLVAGDIIKSVAVAPTYQSVGVLAIIVAIRTFLSFTLEVEMNGRWPWQASPQRKP